MKEGEGRSRREAGGQARRQAEREREAGRDRDSVRDRETEKQSQRDNLLPTVDPCEHYCNKLHTQSTSWQSRRSFTVPAARFIRHFSIFQRCILKPTPNVIIQDYTFSTACNQRIPRPALWCIDLSNIEMGLHVSLNLFKLI